MNADFYTVLLNGLPDNGEAVAEVFHGRSWTAVRLSNGSVGAAMHTEGETVARMFPSLTGLPAKEAAKAVLSWNFEEASEGMAVINACYNRIERVRAMGAESRLSGALDDIALSGKTVGLVGHLLHHSGITEQVLSAAKQYYIMERAPKPGDYPDPACEYLLPLCDVVVITGSAAINKTMPRLLELAAKARIILTGPSVPLCGELASLGISRLYGLAVEDGESLCRSILSAPGSINRFGKRFLLDFQ